MLNCVCGIVQWRQLQVYVNAVWKVYLEQKVQIPLDFLIVLLVWWVLCKLHKLLYSWRLVQLDFLSLCLAWCLWLADLSVWRQLDVIERKQVFFNLACWWIERQRGTGQWVECSHLLVMDFLIDSNACDIRHVFPWPLNLWLLFLNLIIPLPISFGFIAFP